MEELIKRIELSGWFMGELKVDIKIRRCFEGYHGRASEDWETQYEFISNEIKNTKGEIVFPLINIKSNRYETFNDFIKRINIQL